jgi:hypothetical protein
VARDADGRLSEKGKSIMTAGLGEPKMLYTALNNVKTQGRRYVALLLLNEAR